MPEKRVCDGCAKEFWWPGAQWQHDGCVVAVQSSVLGVASNGVANSSSASNTVHLTKTDIAADEGVKKQRWDREKYNAYQRELMRERRAAEKSRVSP